MKAYTCDNYGAAETLQLQEVEQPRPKADELLIHLHATSLNSWDWDKLRGHVLTRFEGLRAPADRILGGDVAGIVTAIGDDVKNFAIGDRVFGDLSQSGWGAFAEYTTGKAHHFAKMPDNISFAEAATIPQAGLLALQALRTADVQPCMHVLINGGGSGTGMFAIQLAKYYGATVHAVDNAEKQEAMTIFGADHVYDYKQVNFTRLSQKFDIVIELVAQRSPAQCLRSLKSRGKYIVVGGKPLNLLRLFLAGRKTREDGKIVKILMWENNPEDMLTLAEMVRDKKIRCFIEEVFPFEKLKSAVDAQANYLAKGKHVVHMLPENAENSTTQA
ncbi:NADPH:quinone reductase-like Zn-dependent oxidoreductase [Maritalea mobilis]|uniref:NADPH:quinone reductase-like Zn-dependent oxidoreductase n=1 Tax=Maritalea mobilis TaxID=483324 RepID=A0A4R6VWW3_9HYPH|nr:NAD(P)-dependent alcohol dehydrogenase [Maritalea mobilis]TDQ67376.1 NADPH:quinone reductase-like Zn-dependent oxidoreductase [Maritalea mobilis]